MKNSKFPMDKWTKGRINRLLTKLLTYEHGLIKGRNLSEFEWEKIKKIVLDEIGLTKS